MEKLPDYNKILFPDVDSLTLDYLVPNATKDALDLLKRILVYDPLKRITAKEVLKT